MDFAPAHHARTLIIVSFTDSYNEAAPYLAWLSLICAKLQVGSFFRDVLFVSVALFALAACQRDEEAAQRAWLGQWFALGETLSFAATRGCAVGLYRLVTPEVKSALPVTRDVARMRREIAGRGAAALGVPGITADAAMVAMMDQHRETGRAMRRAGLEARACMDARGESVFRHALDDGRTVLGWDAARGALLLMMPGEGLLVAAMGEG